MEIEPYRGASPLARSGDEERARNVLARDLLGDERLIWAGRPKQGVYLTAADAVMIPFSLAWGGFAIFWEVSAITMGAPLFFCLFGAPFVLIGLYIMVGRFFFDARRRARTFYGLTDRRVLIVQDGSSRKLVSIDLASAGEVQLEERADGSGSLVFGPPGMSSPMRFTGIPGKGGPAPPTLQRIANAREVMARVREAQSSLFKR